MPAPPRPCCKTRQELDDARRELNGCWAGLNWDHPLYDVIRQVRDIERAKWTVLEPVAQELRAMAEGIRESHLAPMLRRLADQLDP